MTVRGWTIFRFASMENVFEVATPEAGETVNILSTAVSHILGGKDSRSNRVVV